MGVGDFGIARPPMLCLQCISLKARNIKNQFSICAFILYMLLPVEPVVPMLICEVSRGEAAK